MYIEIGGQLVRVGSPTVEDRLRDSVSTWASEESFST